MFLINVNVTCNSTFLSIRLVCYQANKLKLLHLVNFVYNFATCLAKVKVDCCIFKQMMDLHKIIQDALYEFIQSYIPDADLRYVAYG